jgi:uncharacterized membrane protein YfcA
MNIFIAVLIGAVGGIVAALCGVGGGVVMVPAFVFLFKMGQKTAVATSLAAIILTAFATTAKNHANGFIDWKIALPAGIAGGLVGWSAADLLKRLSDITLVRIFATLIIIFGIQMWVQSFNKPDSLNISSPSVAQKNQEN